MLPLDLLRYRIQEDEVSPRYLNPKNRKYRAIARDLIAIYTTHLNKTKGALVSALADYEAADTNYQIKRGFAKLLEDRSEFTIQSPVEPEVLREKIFAYGSKHHPIVTKSDRLHRHTRPKALAKIADEFNISGDAVMDGMYADLEENRILTEFDPPTAEWLLDRYNVALAQAMLYRASEMTIRIYRNIPKKYKLVFQFIKFFKLMHVVDGNNTDGYQTSYVYHIENPIRFEKEIRVTIEHGHGNHLSNEMASVAYWYQIEPHAPFSILPVAQRTPVLRNESGAWPALIPSAEPALNDEMKQMKQKWSDKE